MLVKTKMKTLFPSGRKMVFLALTAASLLVQVSCKDDDDDIVGDGGSKTDPTAIIPAKDKQFRYKITEEEGGVSTVVTRVKSTKDSSGITVFTIESKTTDDDGQSVLLSNAYSKSGITTHEISLPAAYSGILSELEGNDYIKDVKITGFPHLQQMENKAAVGSKMTFKGEPIKLVIKMEIPTEGGQVVKSQIEATITYDDGEVTKVENITTPGGTFNCSKWEYSYTAIIKTFINGELEEQSNEFRLVTDWTAPGVGVVKSIESDVLATPTSITELQKID